MDYGNTKTPRVHRRLGSATLSQLAFPRESNLNFLREKSHWNNTVVKKPQKNPKLPVGDNANETRESEWVSILSRERSTGTSLYQSSNLDSGSNTDSLAQKSPGPGQGKGPEALRPRSPSPWHQKLRQFWLRTKDNDVTVVHFSFKILTSEEKATHPFHFETTWQGCRPPLLQ